MEQWGLVINEAMAAGAPVLVSDQCGATRTMVRDGVSGVITEPSKTAIEIGLSRILDMSPEARNSMGEAACRAIAEWGPERFGIGLYEASITALAHVQERDLSILDRIILTKIERSSIERVL